MFINEIPVDLPEDVQSEQTALKWCIFSRYVASHDITSCPWYARRFWFHGAVLVVFL